jgi:hypothetical protein
MSESDFNSPFWRSDFAVTQGPELSVPRFNPHATPFAQPIRHRTYDDQYNQFLDFTMNHLPDHNPARNHPQTLPNPYDESHQRPPGHYSPFSGLYPQMLAQPPVPRQPVFSANRPSGEHPELTGLVGAGNGHNLPRHPFSPGVAGSPPPYPQGYDMSFAPANPIVPSLRHYHHTPLDLQPQIRYSGGHDFEPPARQSPDRPRPFPFGRRSSQQGSRQHSGINNSNNRPYDHSERRASRLSNAQGRLPDSNTSSPTSGRRTYDHFIHDISRAMTSSDAEEAAARVPPSFRSRRLPREPRLRFSSHVQHQDPNLATPRQMQELKEKLPRRLPCELPEGTSHTCDICAKDYSSTHVQACESDEVAIQLPCGHCFGEFCIFEWVRAACFRLVLANILLTNIQFDTCKKHKNKVTCPMCRKQLIEPSRYHPSLLLSAMTQGDPAIEEMLVNELRGGFAPL